MPQTIDLPFLDDSEVYGPSIPSAQTIDLPFIDGGWVFGPAVTGADEAVLEVLVGSTVMDGSFGRNWRDQLADTGAFSFTVQRDDPDLAAVDFDMPVYFRVDGVTAFQGIVESIDDTMLDQSEEAGQTVTISGRGALAIAEQAVVYPSRGVDSLPIEEVRSFSWPAPDFPDASWPAAKKIRPHLDGNSPRPWIWPDKTGYWIWANRPDVTGTNAPAGDCYFRKTFSLDQDTFVRIFCAFDNRGSLYIDGANLTSFDGYTVGRYVELELSEGDHVIGAWARNFGGYIPVPPGPVQDPGGFIAAVYTVDANTGLLDELVTHTDATWKCLGYPAKVPGFTHGEVLRILVEEAQAQGALDGVTLGFTDDLDSDGLPWSDYREVTAQVGRTLLDVLRELSDAFIDVAMAPGALTLRAWRHGGRGTTRSVTLAQTSDPDTSDFLALNHQGRRTRLNRSLVRYADGWRERVDTSSVGTYGSKGGYLELGSVRGEAEAYRIADKLMENRAQPTYATQATLLPSSDATTPYKAFGLGDTITCPDETGTNVAMRVRGITMSEDENGVITWPVELREDALEVEERHDAWLRRMADGDLAGGTRVASRAGTPAPISQQVTALRVAEFSYDNDTLEASLSPVRPAEASGNMVEIFAEVTTAGSTATTVRVLLNGVTLGSNLTIPAGETSAEIPLTIVPVRANVDKLQCEIVTAGTGAEGLDVQVRAI